MEYTCPDDRTHNTADSAESTNNFSNGVLLCQYHHREIHKEQWHIIFASDGAPEFVPPPWIDTERKPQRNTVHHQLAAIAD